MGFEEVRVSIDFQVNDNVRVMNGSLQGFIGIVQEINRQKNKAKIMVSMFGRETPVEVDFTEIEKI
jgi:transcriptional antiterminator NusG